MASFSEMDWASPPGATIKDVILQKKWSIEYFADLLEMNATSIVDLLNGKLEINYDLAISLADNVGGSPSFWIQRERNYRDDLIRILKPSESLKKKWLSKFPISDFQNYGWLPKSSNIDIKFQECLKFFDVKDILEWEDKYTSFIEAVAYRTSKTYEQDFAATAAWLRQGEIKSNDINCKEWNSEKLIASLCTIKRFVREKNPKVFLPAVRQILSNCGVALVIAQTPKGCHASGATKFLTPEKAMLLLSFKYRSDDHFWFTLFHELGHLVLHGKEKLFFESTNFVIDAAEKQANDFAQKILLPESELQEAIKLAKNYKSLIQLACKFGISAGVLVGQLQFHKHIDVKKFNFLKRRYNWNEIDNATL